jgi:hypothetical protein
MIEICDPDVDPNVLKKLIKINTGHDIKLTKEQICQVYDDIRADKLPLPPLIMSSDKTYLIDKKSPLKVRDYEILFASSSTRKDIKRVARKVGLNQVEQMTKGQMIDSIGKRLMYMNVYEPIKIGRKPASRSTVRKFNTTAVNNKNTTAVNNFMNNTTINAGNNVRNNLTNNIGNNLTNNVGINRSPFQKNINFNLNKPSRRVNFPNRLFQKKNNSERGDINNTQTKVKFPKTLFTTNPFKPENKKPNNVVENRKPNNMVENRKPNNVVENRKPNNVVENRKPNNVVENKNPNNVVENRKPNNVVENKKPNNTTRKQNQKFPNDRASVVKLPNTQNQENIEKLRRELKEIREQPVKENANMEKLRQELKAAEEQREKNIENAKKLQQELKAAVEQRKKDTTNAKARAKVENLERQVKKAEEKRIQAERNANVQRRKQKLKEAEQRRKNNARAIKQKAKAENLQRRIKKAEERRIQAAKNANIQRTKQQLKEAEQRVNEEKERQMREAAERRIKIQQKANAEKVRAEERRTINKGKNRLSNMIIDANLKTNFMNKVTNIETIENLKRVENQIVSTITSKKNTKNKEISKYMKNLGLNNQDIRVVLARNLSVNNSREEANKILTKKKRLKLTKLLDEKKIPVANRKQFYNQMNQDNIESIINDYVKNKSRENTNNIKTILNKYNLKNEDKQSISNEWNQYENMTLGEVKNQASRREAEFKKEKGTSLRLYMKNDLKLGQNDIDTVMKNFNLNSRNMGALRTKAMNLSKLSGEKNRITERIRKAREENGLNLKFNVEKIKSANNIKNLNANINQAYLGKAKKNLSRRALNRNVNISDELDAIKSMNNVQKLKNKLNGIIKGKNGEDLKKLEEVIKNLNQENRNRFLQKFKNQNNSLNNLLKNVQNFKNNKARVQAEAKTKLEAEQAAKKLRNELEKKVKAKPIPIYNNSSNSNNNDGEIFKENKENNKKFITTSFNNPMADPTMANNPLFGNNNNNFNAAAELNKQLNIEGKRQNKNLANRKREVTNKAKKEVAKFFGRIGKWRPAISKATTIRELNNIEKNLNNRVKLRNDIRKSVLTPREQSEYASMVMKLNKKVANTRKLFENRVNKKVSNVTGPLVKGILNKTVANNKRGSFNGGLRLGNNNNNIISGKPKPIYNNSNSNNNVNNKKKPNMKPNPIFEPNMQNNPAFENNKPKLTIENKKPLISAINSLKKLPQNKKTMFKGQINTAFKNQNLNKMKAIRNEAIAANKMIRNQLAEEKRLKEKAKEAKRKEEAEKMAAKKAEREAKEEERRKKEANNIKRQLNAANNVLRLANIALKEKEAASNRPSFKAMVQKNKERRVMNAVKTASQKTAISQATGAERVKLARKFAPSTQANVKKTNEASKVFKTNVRKAAEGAAESAKEKLRKNAEKKATLSNKSSYQAKINSQYFKLPTNRKKLYTSRIQKAKTLGEVLKAYNNAEKERNLKK